MSRGTNRLIHERSPYLLQHAHNPVDWFPWGPEAFARARELDRPVFLSVGYATCHWCHVMERESFEDQGLAAYLNEHFVSIKVDREERPDVDHVYMAAVQALSGQGGWPMSVFLDEGGRPFWGGTYFPPQGRGGRPGFREVLAGIHEAWQARRGDIQSSAAELTRALGAAAAGGRPGEAPGREALDQALADHRHAFDERWGGFGGAPKFPRPHALSLLLRLYQRRREDDILHLVELTLDRMAQGGIRDHLGGGFARYSTDERWLVPHFEKMLYDQALLVRAYVEAYQLTGHDRHAAIAREILGYVRRVLTDAGGAFYSAEDADSEGEEGRFYVWTPDQIDEVLGAGRGAAFRAYYGVTERGNFEGRNIPWTPASDPEREYALAGARAELLEEREQRPRPLLDDKILTAWNGLMISALARASLALDDPAYTAAAARAADFILTRMQADGRLLRRHRVGDSAQPGFLEDYACLAQGLLDLHQADLDPRWLDESQRLTWAMLDLFWDEPRGALRCSGKDAERLVAETIEIYDGAVPSGNSVATLLLLRLGQLTGEAGLLGPAERLLATFGPVVAARAEAFPYFLLAVDHHLGPRQEIVLEGRRGDPALTALQREAARRFLPRAVIAARASAGPARAFLCEDQHCRLPVSAPAELGAMLAEL